MARFNVIYYAPPEMSAAMANASPEDVEKEMAGWMAWAERCGAALVDMGTPLGPGMTVLNSGGGTASSSHVTGYSFLEAEDMDAALALLQGHPHMNGPGCSIEVHQSMDLPGA